MQAGAQVVDTALPLHLLVGSPTTPPSLAIAEPVRLSAKGQEKIEVAMIVMAKGRLTASSRSPVRTARST